MGDVGVILGSAYSGVEVPDATPVVFDTPYGLKQLHRVDRDGSAAWISYRHGMPHDRLPHQINYRAQACALRAAGVRSLLVTSSCGVLDASIPLFTPMLVSDVIMLDNRLPDGSACTVFFDHNAHAGHLVLDEGLFSQALGAQVEALAARREVSIGAPVVFGYQVGPRVKTAAENRMWRLLGAQVNSMTLAPEVVLACELGIACAGLVVGHKLAGPDAMVLDDHEVAASLSSSRTAIQALVLAFLHEAESVPTRNHMYRFNK